MYFDHTNSPYPLSISQLFLLHNMSPLLLYEFLNDSLSLIRVAYMSMDVVLFNRA